MMLSRRRRLFVDFRLQGALLVRMVVYWFYCLLSVTLIAGCWAVLVHRPASSGELFRLLWGSFGPALLGSVLLLPLVLMDCLRLSNRFAGPMVRLREAMQRLANGERVQPVQVRAGDFWSDFAADFNRFLSRQTVSAGARDCAEPSPLAGPQSGSAGGTGDGEPLDVLPADSHARI